jgi:TPR repeat protein
MSRRFAFFLTAGLFMIQFLFAADLPNGDELKSSAASGDAQAQFALGRAYFRGEGAPKDDQQAFAWIEKSAEQGNPDAMTSMGFFYAQGITVPANEEKAVAWFRKGAEAGCGKSMLNLGLTLRQAKTMERNHEESVQWLDRAAASGDPDATRTVGQLYFMGDALMMPEREKAYPLVLKAAEAGDPECQNVMGLICLEGLGPEANHKDLEKALHWFRLSAEQGNAKGQSNLAHALGVESPASGKRQEALMWLYMAVDQGEPLADKTLKEIFMSIPPELAQRARADVIKKMSGPKATMDDQKKQPLETSELEQPASKSVNE